MKQLKAFLFFKIYFRESIEKEPGAQVPFPFGEQTKPYPIVELVC